MILKPALQKSHKRILSIEEEDGLKHLSIGKNKVYEWNVRANEIQNRIYHVQHSNTAEP